MEKRICLHILREVVHPNAALVTRFYEAFRAIDAEAMAACYHPDATFSDPVFPALHGSEIGRMWRMLATGARAFHLTYGDVRADDTAGSAKWEARYAFSRTRRPVHNLIEARFEFRDGLIWRHVDTFDLYRWSRMALGPPGVLLGWSPLLQARIRRDAAARLAAFQ